MTVEVNVRDWSHDAGDFDAAIHMVNVFESMNAIPIVTCVVGPVRDLGVVIAATGTKGHRYISPDASLVISSRFAQDHPNELDVKKAEVLLEALCDATGKRIAWFYNKLRSGDLTMTPQEAVKEGFADRGTLND